MTILLFGVSNVGKSTMGKLLAEKLGYDFYDLDDEVKKYYDMTLEEFVHRGNLRQRDRKCGVVLREILKAENNKVIAVTPISYTENFSHYLTCVDVLAIELRDTVENIFDRLVFSDENDVIYTDDDYKNAHKEHYLREIQGDLDYYGTYSFKMITNKFDINGDTPEKAVERLIHEFHLSDPWKEKEGIDIWSELEFEDEKDSDIRSEDEEEDTEFSYEEYMKKCEKIREVNDELLELFEADMDHLSYKTRKKHLDNVDFYINEYLLKGEPLTFEYGISKISDFLGDFFIRKCMWSTPETIQTTAASIKRFYKCMVNHEKISEKDYQRLCDKIKEEMPQWQEKCALYNDPEQVDLFSFF